MSLVDANTQGITLFEEDGKINVKFTVTADARAAVQAAQSWVFDKVDEIYYYEVAVKAMNEAVGIGLALAGFPTLKAMPGWVRGSFAYHGDDGKRFNSGQAKDGWPTFGIGDVAGLGLKVATGEIFGTLNGKYLGVVATTSQKEPLFPTIGFVQDGEAEVLLQKKDHKFDLSSLPEFLIPFFAPLEKVDLSQKMLVLFTNGLDEDKRTHLNGQLEGASKTVKNQYGFQSLYTHGTEGRSNAVRDFVGVKDRSPLLIAIVEDKKYAIPEGEEITTESILKFASDIAAGKLAELKKTAPRPPGDKHPKCPTLVQVVGSSFDELVIGGTKDVLLDVYADWCGPCRAVAPTLEILSEIFADNDHIAIAKIDCEDNDIDRTYLPETSIPNIKLFKGADKKNPLKYQGNRSLDNFLEFLHTNATVTFDLEAAKAKGKELAAQSAKKALKNVVPIHKSEDFKTQLGTDKLVIVDYFATWCGPCKAIAPLYADLSEEYKDKVVFLKVDVDELQDVSKEQGVACMPTFKAYKKGTEVGKLEGADPKALKKLITDNL